MGRGRSCGRYVRSELERRLRLTARLLRARARRADPGRRRGGAAGDRGHAASEDEAFGRTADALHALAAGDRDAYETAVTAIVADFAAREDHLTGVAFADTAVMLERLAAPRGMAVRPASAVMPVLG